jgi:hypothetical protein
LDRGQIFEAFWRNGEQKGFTFSDIEIEFHKGCLVSFDIDTSETELSLAQFNAVTTL